MCFKSIKAMEESTFMILKRIIQTKEQPSLTRTITIFLILIKTDENPGLLKTQNKFECIMMI